MKIPVLAWLSNPKIRSILWLAIPLLAGILVSLLIPRPAIGVIQFRDEIYSATAGELVAQITAAREDSSIHAVVLILDSPGGTVADTETVYLELARLRALKPVVTVVENMAASGAYYLAAGTDYLVVAPSSVVGNIGVRTVLPAAPSVYEDDISTGPYKFYGDSRDSTLRSLEPIKQGFFEAVVLGRGKALKATPAEILSGKIFLGTEAVRLGLADALGGQSDAFAEAANLAHIGNFRTVDLRDLAGLPEPAGSTFFATNSEGALTAMPREPGVYLLYIPPAEGRLP